MDRFRQSLVRAPFPISSTIFTTWNKVLVASVLFLLCAAVSGSDEESNVAAGRGIRTSRDMFYGMTPSPITRIHRISNARLNSRFLRTFPSLEFLHMARREGQLVPQDTDASSHRQFGRHHSGNSPVFYIRLPPAPYMFVPGLGYVSPHPYNTPMIPPSPVMMNPLGMMMSGMEMEDDSSSSSNENAMEQHHNNNVISLPLKFLSNGRPAQIQNPKPRAPHPNSKYTSLKPEPSKTTHLISSGKYSFNGRPNGVFIVRSPTAGSPNSIL